MIDAGGLPLVEELLTSRTPLELFEVFCKDPESFFLDSALSSVKLGRYSLMGSGPFLKLKSYGDSTRIIRDNCEINIKGNPLDVLGKYLEKYRLPNTDLRVPCAAGAVGYLSYDLGRHLERLPAKAIDDLHFPESYFGFYDIILVFDNLTKRSYLVSTGFPEVDPLKRFSRAGERLDEIKNRISSFIPADKKEPASLSHAGRTRFTSNFTHTDYIKTVEKARRYIIEGDIFEVNLSQRFEAEIDIPPFELYRRLRRINPAPFASYLDFGETVIVGSSPERFLRLQGDRVETRPIKGTARRGRDFQEDAESAEQLLHSEKDRAENMMIVDLERNDLGRVCRYGSVKVTELAILEEYPTVFHLTSTIAGRLRQGVSNIDLLKATFPGGSITGAPKIRSMEIIDELEPTRRSIYTGSLGYIGFEGNLDLNIVIRTFLLKGKRAYFQVGGAVTCDSNPEAEYQETLDKAKALFAALGEE